MPLEADSSAKLLGVFGIAGRHLAAIFALFWRLISEFWLHPALVARADRTKISCGAGMCRAPLTNTGFRMQSRRADSNRALRFFCALFPTELQ